MNAYGGGLGRGARGTPRAERGAERTICVSATTHAARAKSGASPLKMGSRKVYNFIKMIQKTQAALRFLYHFEAGAMFRQQAKPRGVVEEFCE